MTRAEAPCLLVNFVMGRRSSGSRMLSFDYLTPLTPDSGTVKFAPLLLGKSSKKSPLEGAPWETQKTSPTPGGRDRLGFRHLTEIPDSSLPTLTLGGGEVEQTDGNLPTHDNIFQI